MSEALEGGPSVGGPAFWVQVTMQHWAGGACIE